MRARGISFDQVLGYLTIGSYDRPLGVATDRSVSAVRQLDATYMAPEREANLGNNRFLERSQAEE